MSEIETFAEVVITLWFSSSQPLKLYPVLSGVGNVPYAWSYVTCFVEVAFPLAFVHPVVVGIVPPFASTVTVYLFALQITNNVALFVVVLGVYAPSLVYIIVSEFELFTYPHVYPVFSTTGNVTFTAVQFAVNVTVPLSLLKFLKYVSVVFVLALLQSVLTLPDVLPCFAVDVFPLA